jgi:hypothetical protein
MKFRRNPPASTDNEATAANPVPLPNVEAVPVETFLEAAKEVMEKHASTLEKLAKTDTNNYTEKAFGLFKDKKTGMWNVVEVSYDPDNLNVNPKLELIQAGTDKSEGLERLEIISYQRLVSPVLHR